MGILAYQIGIFIAILIASLMGKRSRNTAVILISIFTLLQVYTSKLMILQFITIIVAFIISQNKFSNKKKSQTPKILESNDKLKTHVKKKEKSIIAKIPKHEYDQMYRDSMKAVYNMFDEEKNDLAQGLESHLSYFKQDLKNPVLTNKVEIFNEQIIQTEERINLFKKAHNPIVSNSDFEYYIIMYNMVLAKLKETKDDYIINNNLPNIDEMINELVYFYHKKTKRYTLNKENYRRV